jgi:branched-subunit amino acid permease
MRQLGVATQAGCWAIEYYTACTSNRLGESMGQVIVPVLLVVDGAGA